ncbi:DNA resolvase, partial [Bacteroides cellulosilyticus]
ALLKKGYSIRNIAKLQGIGISTVQRIKNQFVK